MHIRGAMSAQIAYQKKYNTKYDKHHFPAYLVSHVMSSDLSHKHLKTSQIDLLILLCYLIMNNLI